MAPCSSRQLSHGCFPLFAGVITTVGLVTLGNFERFALYALQGFTLLSLFGLALAVRQHRSPWPLVLGVTSPVALAWSLHGAFSQGVLYGGLFGLLAATVWNRLLSRCYRCGTPERSSSGVPSRQPVLQSIITCPECGRRATALRCLRVHLRLPGMSRSSQAQTGRLLRFLQLRLSAMPAYPAGSDMLLLVASPIRRIVVGSLAPYFLPLTDAQNLPSGSGFRQYLENNQRNKQDERSGPGFNLKLPSLERGCGLL